MKCKLSNDLGHANESHCHECVNFSRRKIPMTSLCRLSCNSHVGQVIETKVVNMPQHIACTRPKSEVMRCALQSLTHAKCISKIGPNMPMPSFEGNFKPSNMKKYRQKMMWLCSSNIKLCVEGSVQSSIFSKSGIPFIWPIKINTNLTSLDRFSLEDACFKLECFCCPLSHVGDVLSDLIVKHPTIQVGNFFSLCQPSYDYFMKMYLACLLPLHIVTRVQLSLPSNDKVYIVSNHNRTTPDVEHVLRVNKYPMCGCPNYHDMYYASIGVRGKHVSCEHMYQILFLLSLGLILMWTFVSTIYLECIIVCQVIGR